jgi:hypothetical protein
MILLGYILTIGIFVGSGVHWKITALISGIILGLTVIMVILEYHLIKNKVAARHFVSVDAEVIQIIWKDMRLLTALLQDCDESQKDYFAKEKERLEKLQTSLQCYP